MMNKIENAVIRKYGFENKRTIAVFRATEIMRKICFVRISNIEDCPFEPSHIEGKKIRFFVKNFAIAY